MLLSRGQMRINGSRYGGGSAGPPFLVCALIVGLCIISISYYSLSSQYTQLETHMGELVKQHTVLQGQIESQQKVLQEKQIQLDINTKQTEQQMVNNAKLKEELIRKKDELIQIKQKMSELDRVEKELRKQLSEEKQKAVKASAELASVHASNLAKNKQPKFPDDQQPKTNHLSGPISDALGINASNRNSQDDTQQERPKGNSVIQLVKTRLSEGVAAKNQPQEVKHEKHEPSL